MRLPLALFLLVACPASVLVVVAKSRDAATDPRASSANVTPSLTKANLSFTERRATFRTKLTRRGPAPQEWWSELPPDRAREINYRSGDLELRAWIQFPRLRSQRHPAVVYFHGGFAFSSSDLEHCRPFIDAGFVVMCPMLRGENGNPGHFEMFLGEVDDARAATQWLAQQPFVATGQIYTFGHSSGGAVSALLSLLDDVPIRHGGSAGGLYGSTTFDTWERFVPFDLDNPEERQMRLLLGNVHDMQRYHFAYIGRADRMQRYLPEARRETAHGGTKLVIFKTGGDHLTSLRPAMLDYIRIIRRTGMQPRPRPR
ncbi:MAG: alpha/beta hydrolase family protein [Planctomycetota bacterium]|jgi:acetyl esterase/lipase